MPLEPGPHLNSQWTIDDLYMVDVAHTQNPGYMQSKAEALAAINSQEHIVPSAYTTHKPLLS
jgi:hypothetical protein